MSVRWEFAHAGYVCPELLDAKLIRRQAGENIGADQLALTFSYDEVFAIVGTRDQLRELAQRIAGIVEQDPETVEQVQCDHCYEFYDEGGDSYCGLCPDCADRQCVGCDDVVGYLSTGGLCDGCVAEQVAS